jgi:hypothetical protein
MLQAVTGNASPSVGNHSSMTVLVTSRFTVAVIYVECRRNSGMKRLVLRFTAAILAFGFGLAIYQIAVSRVQKPRTVWKLEPVVAQPVAACPAASPIPLPNPTPTQYLIFDYNPVKFNPRGTYYPLSPLPDEFAEFDLFEIASDEFAGKGTGSAIVQIRTSDFQNASYMLITEKRLMFFASQRLDTHFEYRFEGEFLGNPARLTDTGKAAVRGTLTKMRDGHKVAERVVSFDVRYLGC